MGLKSALTSLLLPAAGAGGAGISGILSGSQAFSQIGLDSPEVLSTMLQKKKEMDEFNSNPFLRIGSLFGLADKPKGLTEMDLFGAGPANEGEQTNRELGVFFANSLLGF